MKLMRSVRRALPVAVLGLVVALAGCGGAPGAPDRPTTPPSTVSAQGGDLRTRLANAFGQSSPATALLVKDSDTTLNEIKLQGLTGWILVNVTNQRPPHPRQVAVALSDSGTGKVLSGHPEALNSVLRSNLSGLDSVSAVTAAQTFLDLTRDTSTWSYRVQSADNINWLPKPNAEQAKRRDQVTAEFKDQIAAPKAVEQSGGWLVTLWTVRGTDLVRHKITVGNDGSITDNQTVAASNLPVPISV